LADVATAAGVSTATVSRALRGLDSVSAETKARVCRVAEELGYVPSHSASALASGRTRSVAIVTPAIARWFYSTLIDGVEHELRRHGYDALLYAIAEDDDPARGFRASVLRRRADAVVVASSTMTDEETEALRSLRLPAVFVSVPGEGFPFVGVDDRTIGRLATEHLIELGHRRIGHIYGHPKHESPCSPTALRRAAWQETLAAHGLPTGPELLATGDFSSESGRIALHRLLDADPELTAVFVASDEMAYGALRALAERGLTPGEDVSILGVDGHGLNDVLGLTSIEQPVRDQGRMAADVVLRLLEDIDDTSPSPGTATTTPNGPRIIYETTLVRRRSTGVPSH
jgi:DNA-binding LacI/PurR family transcriptional regulator